MQSKKFFERPRNSLVASDGVASDVADGGVADGVAGGCTFTACAIGTGVSSGTGTASGVALDGNCLPEKRRLQEPAMSDRTLTERMGTSNIQLKEVAI